MENELLCLPSEHDDRWSFSPEDLRIAKTAFLLIVHGEPRRALRLDSVIRWQPKAWEALSDTLRVTAFDRTNPQHITALQWLIDQACDAEREI